MRIERDHRGWLVVPHKGGATDQAFIGFGQREPEEWHPAFKRIRQSGRKRTRVLTVPPPQWRGTVTVWTRVNGVESRIGTLRL